MIRAGDKIRILTHCPYSTPFIRDEIVTVYCVNAVDEYIDVGHAAACSWVLPFKGEGTHYEIVASPTGLNATPMPTPQNSYEYKINDVIEYDYKGSKIKAKVIAIKLINNFQFLLLDNNSETFGDSVRLINSPTTKKAAAETNFSGSHTLGYDPDIDNFWDYKEHI